MARFRKRFKGKRLGHYLMTCDLSGHVGWDDEMVETWDGKWVLKEYFEERHPQDLVRGTHEDWTVPHSRPEPPESYLIDTNPNGVTFGTEEELTNTMIVGQSGRDTALTQADDQYGFMQDPDDLKAPKNYGGLLPAYFEGIQILSLYVNAANLVVLDFGQQHGSYTTVTIRFDLDPTTDVVVTWDAVSSTYQDTDSATYSYLEAKKDQAEQHGKGTIVTFVGNVEQIPS